MTDRPALFAAVVLTATIVASAACVEVRKDENGKTTTVDISTPVGGAVVRAGENTGNAGLPVYPGAQIATGKSDDDFKQANVTIGTPWFGLQVKASEYQSSDSPEQVLSFYREQVQTLGGFTECRGDVDFKDHHPVCRSQPRSDQVEFVEGSEKRQRIVSVKPRNGGTQIALVSVQTGND